MSEVLGGKVEVCDTVLLPSDGVNFVDGVVSVPVIVSAVVFVPFSMLI